MPLLSLFPSLPAFSYRKIVEIPLLLLSLQPKGQEQHIHDLMEDDEIMKKLGIYSYVLSGDLRDLNVYR